MKKAIICCLSAVAVLVACNGGGEQSLSGYSINGVIDNAITGKAVLYNVVDMELNALDSVDIIEGAFSFDGNLAEPEMLYLKINNGKDLIKVFATNDAMTIKASEGKFDEAIVEGSALNTVMVSFKEEYKKRRQDISAAFNVYESSRMSGDTTGMERKWQNYKNTQIGFNNFIKDFVTANNSTPVGPYIVLRYLASNMQVSGMDSIMSTLTTDVQSSIYGKQLQSRIDKIKKVEVGQPALDFTMNDVDGNPVKLSSFKGKYLLVDFWASWCGPCREENPNIVRIKNKFNNNKFEILSVSLDTDRDAWLKAIEDDKLSWTHVSDLKGWKSSAGQLYGVNSIPHTILIDQSGVIIAKNLRGEELEAKLNEEFGKGV